MIEARRFARILAERAYAVGPPLEVRLVKIPRTEKEHWAKRRMTLYNQIDTDGLGAYAHILQTNGSRSILEAIRGRARDALSTQTASVTSTQIVEPQAPRFEGHQPGRDSVQGRRRCRIRRQSSMVSGRASESVSQGR